MYVHDVINTTRPQTYSFTDRTLTDQEIQKLLTTDLPASPMEQGPTCSGEQNTHKVKPVPSKRPKEHDISSSDYTDSECSESEIFTTVTRKTGAKQRKVAPPTHTITPTLVQNKFETLKTLKPPPIVLPPHYTDTISLRNTLLMKGIKDFTIQRCKNGNKIFTPNMKTHDTVKDALTTHKTQYYTFTPKGTPKDKLFVLLGLDLDHPLEGIPSQIKSPELKAVKRMTRTDPNGTRKPIPPVLLTFTHKFNPEHLKAIKSIDQIIVYIRPYREEKGITQCFNCQQYGHSRNNCHLKPRCVRCSKSHPADKCDREKNKLVCSNCGGDHPASYRQCPTRLRLMEKSRSARQPAVEIPTTTHTYRTVDPRMSYADAITNRQHAPPTIPTAPPTQPTTRPPLLPTPITPPQHPIHEHNIPTQATTSDGTPAWVHTLTKNMTDMMTMLMSQFTTLMNLMNRLLPQP